MSAPHASAPATGTPGTQRPMLTVAISVYNERDTILTVLKRVQAVPVEKEIVIVDNCSTDGTRELLRQVDGEARVIFHPGNLGKGASIRTAIQHARGEYLIIQDADLEYDPAEYPMLLDHIRRTGADAVYGSRVLQGRNTLYLKNYYAVRMLTWLTNLLFRVQLTDVATACKLIKTDVARRLPLRCTGFDLDFELTNRLCKHGFRIEEIPVSYRPRSVKEGKKIRAKDGLHALWTILRDRVRP